MAFHRLTADDEYRIIMSDTFKNLLTSLQREGRGLGTTGVAVHA